MVEEERAGLAGGVRGSRREGRRNPSVKALKVWVGHGHSPLIHVVSGPGSGEGDRGNRGGPDLMSRSWRVRANTKLMGNDRN